MNRSVGLFAFGFASMVFASGCGPKSSSSGGPVTLEMDKFTVAAGTEQTLCKVVKFGNAEVMDFSKIESSMSPGSHHFILYRDTSALAGQTPPAEGQGPCRMDLPRLFIYGAQEPQHHEDMPAGVAGEIPKDALLILEAHYVNASAAAIEADVKVTITPPADPSAIHDKAGVIFFMDTTFQIPAGAGFSGADYSHSTTCAVPDGLNIFRLQSHGHKRLDDFTIADTMTGDQLYDSTNWSEPVEMTFPDAAPLHLTNGGGFTFGCSWHNETTGTIGYGPSVEDEMCIMGAGYWPKADGPMHLDGLIFCQDGQVFY